MTSSEITPTAIKIDKIIRRIEEGEIKIPAFQRGFVWNQSQVIELLDSIFHNYPIGSILLWSSKERLKSTRDVGGFKIPEKDPDYPVNYVLDGQQRISAIYAVFCTDRTQLENSIYKVDASIFDIYFDLDVKEFVPKSDLDGTHTNLHLNSLFDMNTFLTVIADFPDDKRQLAHDFFQCFNNYEIPIVAITKREKDEVGIIFERINNTGTKLTTLDLMIAWTWSEDFHLKVQFDDLLETLEGKLCIN